MRKLLIANRGEIAARLILACRELGVGTVAVYATPDAEAPHVGLADEAVALGGHRPAETYLDGERLIAIARDTGCDAIHPGYGFLSEHAGFAAAVRAAGLVFVGPPAEAIAQMGDKLQARRLVEAAGVPVLPGGVLGDDPAEWPGEASFPLMVKAAGGGGGLGMRHVTAPDGLAGAIADARAQCAAAFGIAPADVVLYWEAYLQGARHLEVQIAADDHGHLRSLGVRECSVQRRFQKVVEECPGGALTPAEAEALGRFAEKAAAAIDYRNLATVEFLWSPQRGPAFLEMNTRLQVEHPVTELVTGLDLPQLQLRLAAGEPLATALGEWSPRGHAIEARLYAEDPVTGAPAPGRIDWLRWPTGPWIRVDAGVQEGQEVGPTFDPLLAKLIAWGPTREQARRRLADALARVELAGTLTTNLAQLRAILAAPDFVAGRLDTGFLAGRTLPLATLDGKEAAQLAYAGLSTTEAAAPAGSAGGDWAARIWRQPRGTGA